MRSVPIARARPSCHVNIGRHPSSLSLLLCPPSLRRTRLAKRTVTVNTAQQGSSRSSRDSPSPTSSVSDAIVSFFDDITRGSVSIDEDDIIPDDVTRAITAAKDDVTREVAAAAAAATAAADAAAATAGAAARAAAGAEGLSAAGREWEGAAMTALTAAVAAAGEGISSRDGSSSSSGKAGTVRALETFAAVAQQDLAVGGTGLGSSSGGSGGGSSSSSSSDASKVQPKAVGSGPSGGSSSSSSSKQVVTEEAVKGAGGELQAAALSLTDASEKLSVGQVVVWLFKGVIGVGLLQAFKSGVEAAMQKVGISSIPPAVASMLAVPVLLAILRPSIADRVVQFYDSCIAPWTTDFLGLFYVPAVAILPVLLRGMQGSDLTGLLTVSALSTAATLLLTATAATNWTKQQPTPPPPAASSSSSSSNGFRLVSGPAAPVLLSFAFLAAAGPLAATRFDPLRFGPAMAFPVGFAWSLLGYVAAQVYFQQQQQQQDDPENGGKAMPAWLSPVLAGAVAANIGVAWHGSIMGWGYLGALSRYYTGEVLGAGDLLIAPLGAALTALGVLIYKHRRALALPAIAATATLSAAFSVATSAAAAKLLGVSTDWARAFIPRSVTGSTASHFAQSIGAPTECTGLVVLLQAAFTIALGASILKVLKKGGKLSPAGTAVGVTAGAMGVAGVVGRDEIALANGAMAYAFMVVVGSVLSGIPSIASALAAFVA